LVPGLRWLVEAVKQEGGKICLQIVHGGAQIMGAQIMYDAVLPPRAPSAVKERATGNEPEEMTLEDIRQTVADFAEAARRAKEAGFDAVEIHAAHGYLLSEFLSPYSNRRTDAYGGPIENRARIIFEVYQAIRARVGSDYPVMIKINSADFDEVGLTPGDSLWVSRELSSMGINAIELSGGIPAAGELAPAREKINTPDKEAYFKNHAKELKPEIKCPLVLVGGLRSIEVIEEALTEGAADFFSLARPLISEPGLINRWRSGNRKRARCISCNKCLTAAVEEARLYCVAFAKKDRQSKGG
jgi:2,4-dienoyl-CoA reductase-like NADH-dependent reductase (Old Yellow Enzyme family)